MTAGKQDLLKIRILKLTRSASEIAVTVSSLDTPVIVSEELVHRHRLKEGIVITRSQLARLQSEAELYRCDCEVARLLAIREHSIGEIRIKLARKNFSPGIVRQVVKKYKDRGLLDDARFAVNLAKNLIDHRPSGKSYVVAYLRKKLVDRSLAEQTADALLEGTEEPELALRALKSRWSEFRQFELEVARRKAYNYLARRGFGYEAAKEAFEHLQRQQTEVIED
ncbi:MAG: regulatory protein RecX [Candidatus Zixiibacteriota bacterium]